MIKTNVMRSRFLLAFKRSTLRLLVLWALVGLIGASSVAEAAPTLQTVGPTVSTDPVSAVVACGGATTVVKLQVANVENLYAADVRVLFDPRIVRVEDADPQATGVQIQMLSDFLKPDFVIRRVADNTAGTIWYANTEVSPTLAVTGTGPLAAITFQGIISGTSPLTITNSQLSARGGIPVPNTHINGQIRVTCDLKPVVYLPLILKYFGN